MAYLIAFVLVTLLSLNSLVLEYITSDPESQLMSDVVLLVFLHIGPLVFGHLLFTQNLTARQWVELTGHASVFTICICLVNYLWTLSARHIGAHNVMAIYQTRCIPVYFLSILFLGEKLEWTKLIGLGMAALGVLLLVARSSDQRSQYEMQGFLMVLTMNFIQGLQNIWVVRKFNEQLPGMSKFNSVLLVQVLLAGLHLVLLIPFSLYDRLMGTHYIWIKPSWWHHERLGLFLLSAVIATMVNIGQIWILTRLSPTGWTTMVLLALPLLVVMEYGLKNTVPDILSIMGDVLILAACFLNFAPLSPKKKAKKPELLSME